MANCADVHIKNLLVKSIRVHLKLPDGTVYREGMLEGSGIVDNKFYLPGPEVSLLIYCPDVVDMNCISFKIRTDVDVEVLLVRSCGYWSIRILPNDLPPDVPTTIDIEIGVGEAIC